MDLKRGKPLSHHLGAIGFLFTEPVDTHEFLWHFLHRAVHFGRVVDDDFQL